ncbi:hypothetical protein [Lentzea aerocolonigenes]|uniref:hypothetical protein n=1 Tax=Lentzea aerocolonigenes TaxID=68170 RepID=UPI0012E1F6E7|nr:hypothetical protein [Lentzea aerocolonigenes]
MSFGIMDVSAGEDPCTTFSPLVPAVAFVATSLSLLLLTVHVARFRSVEVSSPEPAEQS